MWCNQHHSSFQNIFIHIKNPWNNQAVTTSYPPSPSQLLVIFNPLHGFMNSPTADTGDTDCLHHAVPPMYNSTTFLSSFNIIFSYQKCIMVSISPNPGEHLLLSTSLITVTLPKLQYLLVILVSSSLMTNDTGHGFMHCLAICLFYLRKCLFKLLAYF